MNQYPATKSSGITKLAIFFGMVGVLVLSLSQLHGQDRSEYVARYLSSSEGLMQNSAYAMLQDEFGFVWIATQIGISRYDGKQFNNRAFRQLSRQGAAGDAYESFVCENTVLCEDPENNLIWVGSCKKLYAISTVSDEFWHVEVPGVPFIRSILVGKGGMPVIGSSGGLFALEWRRGNDTAKVSRMVLHAGSKQAGPPGTGPPDKDAEASSTGAVLALAAHETLAQTWILGTDSGFFRIRQSGSTEAEVLSHVKTSWINAVALRNEGRSGFREEYWCATKDSIFIFGADGNIAGKIAQRRVNCMTPVQLSSAYGEESMLIGTEYDGLLVATVEYAAEDHERAQPIYRITPPTPGAKFNWEGMALSNQVGSMLVARDGTIWIGSKGNGLAKVVRRDQAFSHHFRPFNIPGHIPNNYVWAIYRESDTAPTAWVGTHGNGLARYDIPSEQVTGFYEVDYDPDYNVVRTLAQGNDTLWMGGAAGLHYLPINEIDAQPIRVPGRGTVVEGRRVMALWYEEARRRLWIGMTGGLLGIMENGQIYEVPLPENALVTHIGPGKDDSVMVGTDHGFTQFPADRPRGELQHGPRYLENEHLKSVVPGEGTAFAWAATIGHGLQGLTRYGDGLKKKVFLPRDGLPDPVVYGILSSASGALWISTNRGLSQFFPERGIFINYTVDDGLQHPEFNTGAFFKTGNAFHFGGVNGFNIFHETFGEEAPYLPRVALAYFIADPGGKDEKFLLFDSEPDAEPAIRLDYDYQYIEFRIAALHYQDYAKVNYRYRLYPEGGEVPEWTLLRNQPDFTLSRGNSLESKWFFPQRYVLEVWASDLMGGRGGEDESQPNGSSLRIVLSVSPPYWLTWWFILSVLAVGFLIVVLAFNLQRQNARLRTRNADLQSAYHNTAALADLNEIGQKIVGSLKLEENFDAILEEIRNLSDLRSDVFAVDLLDEQRGVLESRLSLENGQRLSNYTLSLDNPNSFAVACVRLAGEKGPHADGFMINDLSDRSQFPFLEGEPGVQQGRPTRALLFVPLRVGDRVLGAVTVQSYQANVYSAYHLNMLQILSAYTAIAIDHARTTEALLEAERATTRAEQDDLIKSLDIKLLRSQLSPHFIFNSLGTIQYLVSESDPRADDYTARLGEIMREVMMMITRADVTLSTEANFLRGYIAAEVIRFHNEYAFRWRLEIDPALDPDAVYIPPMLLQPFIENSLEHAFYPLPEEGPEIRVYFGRTEDSLVIVVQDNGIGLSREKGRKELGTRRKTSTALQNIRRRAELINQLNGEQDLKMEIRAIDVATASPGEVTCVEKWELQPFSRGARFELHLPFAFKFAATTIKD